jgi:hypothetical protein
LYKQVDMGFAAEAGLFLGGGKGAFCPKKGCNAPSAGYGFQRKKAIFFWGGGVRGRFAQKKGVTLHLRATDFQEFFFWMIY